MDTYAWFTLKGGDKILLQGPSSMPESERWKTVVGSSLHGVKVSDGEGGDPYLVARESVLSVRKKSIRTSSGPLVFLAGDQLDVVDSYDGTILEQIPKVPWSHALERCAHLCRGGVMAKGLCKNLFGPYPDPIGVLTLSIFPLLLQTGEVYGEYIVYRHPSGKIMYGVYNPQEKLFSYESLSTCRLIEEVWHRRFSEGFLNEARQAGIRIFLS